MTKDELIEFQSARVFSSLSRNLLFILEDYKKLHNIKMAALRDALPAEHRSKVDLADYFNDDLYQHLRKRFLDNCGAGRREVEFLLKEMIS